MQISQLQQRIVEQEMQLAAANRQRDLLAAEVASHEEAHQGRDSASAALSDAVVSIANLETQLAEAHATQTAAKQELLDATVGTTPSAAEHQRFICMMHLNLFKGYNDHTSIVFRNDKLIFLGVT